MELQNMEVFIKPYFKVSQVKEASKLDFFCLNILCCLIGV